MDIYQTQILKALFEKERMNYREITYLGINPHATRRELDGLVHEGLIKEEGREKWKQGKKLFYSLTEKGRAEYIRQAFDTLNKTLIDIKEISDAILSDPEKLEEWKKISRKVRFMDNHAYNIYEPLHESYKNLHIIIHLLSLPPPLHHVPMFIGMVDGSICFIPNDFLEEKGFLGPVALRLRPFISNQERKSYPK